MKTLRAAGGALLRAVQLRIPAAVFPRDVQRHVFLHRHPRGASHLHRHVDILKLGWFTDSEGGTRVCSHDAFSLNLSHVRGEMRTFHRILKRRDSLFEA